jgi:hypothetical protein
MAARPSHHHHLALDPDIEALAAAPLATEKEETDLDPGKDGGMPRNGANEATAAATGVGIEVAAAVGGGALAVGVGASAALSGIAAPPAAFSQETEMQAVSDHNGNVGLDVDVEGSGRPPSVVLQEAGAQDVVFNDDDDAVTFGSSITTIPTNNDGGRRDDSHFGVGVGGGASAVPSMALPASSAALLIQGGIRKKQARAKVDGKRREHKAAVGIQGQLRKKSAKKEVQAKRSEVKHNQEAAAATLIQGKVRQKVANKRVKNTKEAAVQGSSGVLLAAPSNTSDGDSWSSGGQGGDGGLGGEEARPVDFSLGNGERTFGRTFQFMPGPLGLELWEFSESLGLGLRDEWGWNFESVANGTHPSIVGGCQEGTQAASLGIPLGSIIVGVNDVPVSDHNATQDLIGAAKANVGDSGGFTLTLAVQEAALPIGFSLGNEERTYECVPGPLGLQLGEFGEGGPSIIEGCGEGTQAFDLGIPLGSIIVGVNGAFVSGHFATLERIGEAKANMGDSGFFTLTVKVA